MKVTHAFAAVMATFLLTACGGGGGGGGPARAVSNTSPI